jgi:hypothetical protein
MCTPRPMIHGKNRRSGPEIGATRGGGPRYRPSMSERAVLPQGLRNQYPTEQVATRLDYNPQNHPRRLDPGADAQRILDSYVNTSGIPGIQERVAYDGGFRVGNGVGPDSQQAVRVSKLLEATSTYYAAQAAQNPGKRSEYLRTAQNILDAREAYEKTTLNYWRGAKQTPADVVGRDGSGGETLLGTDARPIRRAVGQ